MVSLKRSGREIPALINHLQIIPVQTLSVQIDNGYLIQKKCLVSQSSMEDAGGWESQNKTINQTTKTHLFYFRIVITCFASCRSWQQRKPHNASLICVLFSCLFSKSCIQSPYRETCQTEKYKCNIINKKKKSLLI